MILRDFIMAGIMAVAAAFIVVILLARCSEPSSAHTTEWLAIDYAIPIDPSDPDCLTLQNVEERQLPDGSWSGIDDWWTQYGAEFVYPDGGRGLRVGRQYFVFPDDKNYPIGPFVACQ